MSADRNRVFEGRTRAMILSAIVILSFNPFSTASQEPRHETAEDDIREAVVRYQIANWKLAAKTYCLSVDKRSPQKEFLKRFSPLPVVSASECRQKDDGHIGPIVDRKSGQSSVKFDLANLRLISNSEATVEGGYYCGGRCGAWGVYHIVRTDGRWVTTSYEIHMIS
jgi:hypothetical protein